eukprot:Nk52_evm24s208 gene=Nk52_evmTU24s208
MMTRKFTAGAIVLCCAVLVNVLLPVCVGAPAVNVYNLVTDVSEIQTIGGEKTPIPVCFIENGILTVTGLWDAVGCVMLPSTYESQAPIRNSVIFDSGNNDVATIEMYLGVGEGPRNCTGYIPICVECENRDIPDPSVEEPEIPQQSLVTCIKRGDTYTIENLTDDVGCVMRPDNWEGFAPESSTMVFENVPEPGLASVELYGQLGTGPQNCTDYLHQCIECIELPESDGNTSPASSSG